MQAKAQDQRVVGVFAIDTNLTITMWDEELARLTGIAAELASGRRLGPQALRLLIPQLSADFPVPMAIVMHMPMGYTDMYAQKLSEVSALNVREAREGDAMVPGVVLFAPAGKHMKFHRTDDGAVVTHLDVRPFDTLHRSGILWTSQIWSCSTWACRACTVWMSLPNCGSWMVPRASLLPLPIFKLQRAKWLKRRVHAG